MTTVEYQHKTKHFIQQVLLEDSGEYVAKLTNIGTGATKVSCGWQSYTSALHSVQKMYMHATLYGVQP